MIMEEYIGVWNLPENKKGINGTLTINEKTKYFSF